METKLIPCKNLQEKPKHVPSFGTCYTDYMFELTYSDGNWHSPIIKPVSSVGDHPAALVYHYGQSVFEGMKAFITKNEEIQLFRPTENFKRLNRSLERLCMPKLDTTLCLKWLKELILLEQDWIYDEPDASLYIRPFVYSDEPYLGVKPGSTYKFVILLLPVGGYFKGNKIKIKVEEKYVRAAPGGMGDVKTSGNYAASLLATQIARDEGYAEVLWLDAINRKYIDEVGSMNVFFKIGDKVYTPALNGAILPGITRASVIEMLKTWNIEVIEANIDINELEQHYKNGELKEMFGTGTAAVISPIDQLDYKGTKMIMNYVEDSLLHKIKNTLVGMQTGKVKDTFGWIEQVKK